MLYFVLCFIGLLNYAVLDLLFKHAEPIFTLDTTIINILNYSNLLGFALIICFSCYYFSAQIYSAEKALNRKRPKPYITTPAIVARIIPMMLLISMKFKQRTIKVVARITLDKNLKSSLLTLAVGLALAACGGDSSC